MDKTLRDRLEKRARQLGFDSTQAYIRVWATAEVEGRQIDFDEDDWGEPTPEATKRLNRLASEAEHDHKTGKLKSFTSVEDFMADLRL